MRKPRNIILIIADSLRLDSVYQNENSGLPYAEKHAVQFTGARSSGCWTLPGTGSIFTGLMPHEHGATSQSRKIKKNIGTLAEKLKTTNYNTIQITANIVTTELYGLNRGFNAVETARIIMLALALFIKLIFLSSEGPAETIMAGYPLNLSFRVFMPGLFIIDWPLSKIFL